jgi:endonuclease/exonuclease/phosphatase family metal-dependent hydrolase
MPELTVASFNLHWGAGGKLDRHPPYDVVEAAKVLDADVLVLQESWAPDGEPAQHDRIAVELGYTTVLATPMARAVATPTPRLVGRPDAEEGTGHWCLVLLSRLPVTSSRVDPLPRLRTDPATRAVATIEVDVDGRPLAVHGTHMAHLEMGVFLHTRALRRALAPADRAAVLLGDMNMWTWCISAMTPRGWRRLRGQPTFPSRRPLFRIDHLLSTRTVEVLGGEVLPPLGSDHRAIRARLRLR